MIRILSPANGPEEARAVLDAGADEVYCGVMPRDWRDAYTNMASPNRREWEVSNMTSFDVLAATVDAAHRAGGRVFLALNALYTEGQHGEVRRFIEAGGRCGIDALIVADLGVLLMLRDMGWEQEIHVSTGGTAFNAETVRFYADLGVHRVILPRQNRLSEIAAIARGFPNLDIETFILNRGCKNIDGFCTFHHGVNEVRIPLWWRLPKKWHWDYYLLGAMKRLPGRLRDRLGRSGAFGSVGACFLAYDADVRSATATDEERRAMKATLDRNFNLFTGFDTCGACALFDLAAAGVASVKIVGRSNPLAKKVQDVRFLAACRAFLADRAPSREAFRRFARERYAETYGYACHDWCYFPAEDDALGAEAL